jgi:putative ABC transport system permease protein
MMARDVFRLSFQSLRRYPLRTAMLLLAIAIGVASVITLTSVAEGGRRYISGEFSSLGTNLLIILPGRSDTAGAGLQGMLIGETSRDLTLDDAQALARSPNVARFAPLVVGGGAVSWGSRPFAISRAGSSRWALSCPRPTSTFSRPSACSATSSRASFSPARARSASGSGSARRAAA